MSLAEIEKIAMKTFGEYPRRLPNGLIEIGKGIYVNDLGLSILDDVLRKHEDELGETSAKEVSYETPFGKITFNTKP